LSRLLERIGVLLQIEWTYARNAAPAAVREETGIAYAFTSAEQAELLQLARIGYAKGFLRRLAQIKQVDAATIGAINTLKTLAAELRFEAIAKLLEGARDTTVEEHA